MKPLLKRSLIAVGVLAAGLLAAQHWQVRPHVNPNPVKRVVVRGVFPYAQGWELRMWQHFYSNNPECKYTGRAFFIFPTAEVPRTADIAVPLKRIDDQRYEAEYFEDYYMPGHCEWGGGALLAEVTTDGSPVARESLMGSNKRKSMDLDCSTYKSTISKKTYVRARCFPTRETNDPAQTVIHVNFRYIGEKE